MPKASIGWPRVAAVRIGVTMVLTLGAVVLTLSAAGGASVATATGQPAGSPIDLPLGSPSGGPAALVNPEVGTGIGTVAPGNVSEYPGASVPLGMVQFSPDTSPDRQVATGSGYDYADSEISGFSLTHLSGPGCAIYGDIPILPVTGPVPAEPDAAVQPFSHTSEHSSAGNYNVDLGSGNQGIGVQLTATTRSALGAFEFPALPRPARGVSTAGADDLLFKVSDSANGSSSSQVQVVGADSLVGSVTSGNFCGIPGDYTLHFAAQFSEPFISSGTWQNGAVGAKETCSGMASASCGAWLSFRKPGHFGAQRVMVKVGISFVSAAGATANLTAEDPGWSFSGVSRAATEEWNGLLDRVAVHGGSETAWRTFYTALYHSLLFPSVFSDDDGRYMGFDHRVHTLAQGQVQYSNISEADIYRSEVPLLAVLLPGPTSQMVQSLLNDADQTSGDFLPKWVIANNDASQWDGDSVDPLIADAYAYGARGFDLERALKVMIHGATVPEAGFAERQNLTEYLSQGWVPALPTTSPPIPTRTAARRPSSTRSTTSPFRGSPGRRATRPRRPSSPSAVRTGRTCSTRQPDTWLLARPTGASRPARHSNWRAPPTKPREWPSRGSRRATPSSTPGPFPRTWPGCRTDGWRPGGRGQARHLLHPAQCHPVRAL